MSKGKLNLWLRGRRFAGGIIVDLEFDILVDAFEILDEVFCGFGNC